MQQQTQPSPFRILPLTLKARAKHRRERQRAAQEKYRKGLAERGVPELRDLAMLVLAAYCETIDYDAMSDAFSEAIRRRAVEAGFSESETAQRLKMLRRRVLASKRRPSV